MAATVMTELFMLNPRQFTGMAGTRGDKKDYATLAQAPAMKHKYLYNIVFKSYSVPHILLSNICSLAYNKLFKQVIIITRICLATLHFCFVKDSGLAGQPCEGLREPDVND